MTKEKIKEYFTDITKQRKLKILAVLMFIALVIEKIFSGASAVYKNSMIEFNFILTKSDIICVMIYLATAILLLIEVKYKYIVIPDMILLCVKLYNIVYCSILLLSKNYVVTNKWAMIEKFTESMIFSTFLIVLFIGKLSKGKYIQDYTMICLRILIICFVSTFIFEIIELILAYELHKHPFLIVFGFVKGVANELFLDIPYFLLVLTLCFTKENILVHKSHQLV